MSPTSDSFARADRLFAEALDLPPDERDAFLERVCADDPDLRSLLDRLLAGAEGGRAEPLVPGGALAGPLGADLRRELGDAEPLPLGARVGRYRLLRELGRGGMAVVYLAERADGEFAQQVAIKLLQPGLETREIVRRFVTERQILAAARHPGIARLLDGGLTEDGRPYLVMEYVAGLPIDRHADEQRLTVRARVRLVLQVGRAIEDAHRNLIIHRDIKPSNILVTAGGHAKLLDFGIAKLLDPHAPGAPSEATRATSRLLTPAFASPEQIEGAPVTTASDVYQLGLLLYVLLSGRFPYRLGAGQAAEVAREILAAEPLRLTAALAAAGTAGGTAGGTAAPGREPETVEEVARARQTTPARLRRELGGDLETIVSTALRREPERRYGSVAQLLDDLERYLDGRPIAARPDTLAYRLARFGARHRAAVRTAAVALLVLAAVAVGYGVRLRRERDRAERAAAEATQVADFLRRLFAVSAPTRSAGERVTARQLLDQGAARVDRELARQPAVAAEMMTLMGQVYGELALYDEARSLLERAVVLRRRQPAEERGDLASSLQALARVRGESGALPAAGTLYREALAIRESGAARRPDAPDPDLGRALDGFGRILAQQGKYPTAAVFHRRALTLLEAALGPRDPEVGLALHNLGYALRRSGRQREALPHLQRALAILAGRYGPDHPLAAETQVELGVVLWGLHELRAAARQLEAVLPPLEKAYGPDHPQVALALMSYGAVVGESGDPGRAIPLLERSLAIRRAVLGASHPDVASTLVILGRMHWLRGELPRALERFEAARAILEPAVGADHPDLSVIFDCEASILKTLGRFAEARVSLHKAIAVRERALGADSLTLFLPILSLAELEMHTKDFTGAEQTLHRLLRLAQGRPSAEHMLSIPRIDLARCLTALRRYPEAEPLLLPLAVQGIEPTVRYSAVYSLVRLYRAWNRPREAARYSDLLRRLPAPAFDVRD